MKTPKTFLARFSLTLAYFAGAVAVLTGGAILIAELMRLTGGWLFWAALAAGLIFLVHSGMWDRA